MISNTSPKSQKLLEFRDKLARMNGTSLLANQRQKLKQIIDHNKIIQSDISSIFDQISQHYLKWEHQITTVNANIIQFVESNKRKLINLVENLKERELDAIKEDVDQYIKFQKKVKKLSVQLDNTKGKKQALVESINKIKPYNTKNIYSKMEQMQTERQKIQEQIKKFSKLEQTIINLQEIDEHDFSMKKDRREENKIQAYQNAQKMSQILFSSRSSNKLREQQRTFNSNGNIVSTTKLNNLNRYNLIEHLKTDKTSEKEQNLISEQDRVFRKQEDHKFQFKNHKQQEQAQEIMDGKTQKLTTNQNKREKKFNVERKQSQQMGGSSQLKYSIDKFLFQLKKGNANQEEHQMSSREQLSITDQNTKYTAISRVKSQQNLLSQYKRKTGRQPDNIQLTTQIPRIKKIGEKVISSAASNGSQAQNRPNDCKNSSRTGRRGNWASILKQQQAKYNEMRKKLKN